MKTVKSYGSKIHIVVRELNTKNGYGDLHCACGYIGDRYNYNRKIMVSEDVEPTCKKCINKLNKRGE